VGDDVQLADDFRWLTVRHPSQPELSLHLTTPGPPLSEELQAAIHRSLDSGGMPGVGLTVDDCRATYEALKAKGVEFLQEPEERPYGVEALLRDNSGNWMVIVEPRDYRPEDFASDLVAFLDTAGIGRAILVGASSGGVAARMVAGSHPDRVSGLVLLGVPATLADKPAVTGLQEKIEGLSDPVPRAFVEDLMSGMVARPVARGFLETMIDESLKVPAHVWKETMRGLLEADLRATLAGILVPTLVIWGDQDDFLPRSDQQTILDAIHGSRLLTYEGMGHVVHWEQPERVIADLIAFAARTAPAAAP